MLPFCRLESIPLPSLNINVEGLRRQYIIENKGLIYYDLDQNTKDTLKKIYLPENLIKDFDVVLMYINSDYILPHVDSDTKCVINLYLNSDDGVTYFYEIINDNPKKIYGQTDGYIYSEEDLKEVGSFKAKNLESWLLDVTKVHGVKNLENKSMKRLAYSFVSNLDYSYVYRILKNLSIIFSSENKSK